MKRRRIGMLVVLLVLVLKGVGVFAECEEKTFLEALSISIPEPEGEYVTRAEFVKSVLDMVRLPRTDKFEPVFCDVPEKRGDAADLVTAYRAKLIQGEPGGEFRPDDPIVSAEAIKILMNILGYGDYAQAKGGYPAGYLKAAREIELLNRQVSTEEFLTKEQLYFLLAETLEKPMLVPIIYGEKDVTVQKLEGETLLKVYHGIQIYEGIVTADAYTSLTSADGAGEGQIKIGERVFRCGEVNADEYLGIYVKAYYTGEDSFPYLCALRSCPEKTSVSIFKADEILDYRDGRLSYAFEEDKKERFITVSSDADVIYNGRCDVFYDKNRLTSADSVKLVDNDGNHSADVVLVTEYEGTYAVKGVNENRILDKFDRTFLFPQDGYSYERFYEDGKLTNRDVVTKDKVISIALSADGEMITYYISGKTVFGKLEKVSSDGEYSVGGTRYTCTAELQKHMEKKGLLRIGKEITCYLDYDGCIAYADVSGGRIRVGYIMDGAVDNHSFEKNYLLKLLDQTGEVKVFEIRDKVQISAAGAEPEEYKTEEIKKVLGSGDTVQRQLIRYHLKGSGEIYLIETAMEDDKTKPEKFRKQSMNQTYHQESQAFDGGVGVASGAIVFRIPVAGKMDDDECYSVVSRESLKSGSVIACDAYDTSPVNVANYLVVPYDMKVSPMREKEGKPYLITEIGEEVSEDGGVRTFVTAYRNHNAVKIFCKENVLEEAEFAEHSGEVGYEKGIERGDVAGFQFDHKGVAIAACKYLDISEASQENIYNALGPLKNPYSSGSGLHALAMRIWGRAGGSESGFIRVEGNESGYTYQANNASAIVYNVERGTVEKKGYSVLEDCRQDSRYAVYVHFRYSKIEDLFLYELP